MTDDLSGKSIAYLSKLLRNNKISSVELVDYYFDRIEKFDKQIHAFLCTDKKLAMKQAKESDNKIKDGDQGPLTGIPYMLKDNICTNNFPTTAGSKILNDFYSNYDATVVKKLNVEGAVLLGKGNLDEFAMGSSTENSSFGPTKNPWDYDYVPGGSSGGPAAAVSAGFAAFSLGSDTGGSIRQPASLCGVTGLKPSYGVVSRYGLIAFGSSLDQIGPFTNNVEDSALILNAIKGRDENDPTSKDFDKDLFLDQIEDFKNLKIGIPKEYFPETLDKEIKNKITDVIDLLIEYGAEVEEVSLPHTEYALGVYYILAPSEASSNLARYDGVKYGFSDNQVSSMWERIENSRSKGFGIEVKRRIMLGTYALSSGYYDEYYGKAEQVRQLIKQELNDVFKKVDCLITPTSPTTAFKLGERTKDPMAMYTSDIMTIPANIAGIPGISIPGGKVNGLPVGVQLLGSYFSERKLLSIANRIQRITDWHLDRPNLD